MAFPKYLKLACTTNIIFFQDLRIQQYKVFYNSIQKLIIYLFGKLFSNKRNSLKANKPEYCYKNKLSFTSEMGTAGSEEINVKEKLVEMWSKMCVRSLKIAK